MIFEKALCGLPGGFLGVVLSWFFSPVLSGIFAMTFFFIIRKFVLRSSRPFERAVLIYPILVFFCIWIVALFMLIKGIKSSADIKSLAIGVKIGAPLSCDALHRLADHLGIVIIIMHVTGHAYDDDAPASAARMEESSSDNDSSDDDDDVQMAPARRRRRRGP